MFDPTKPIEGTEIDAAELRAQFTGLKGLIDAVPGVTTATVVGVTTISAGAAAAAGVFLNGTALEFTFDIPQGAEGQPGQQGPPFASAVVDGVTSLPPGDTPWVSVYFDGSSVRFSFGLTQGLPGEVSWNQLQSEIASLNNTIPSSNSVPTLDTPLSTADAEVLRAKLNELIMALRR